ncbi:MAG: hypothetical protein NTZ13_03550 [Candidatus Parcubacteria bacterium]|nr:hypothetical protein [Candidatus Parcubacteria bacterium]
MGMRKEDKKIVWMVIVGVLVTPFAIYILPHLEAFVESLLALIH